MHDLKEIHTSINFLRYGYFNKSMDMHYHLLCNWNLSFRKSSNRPSIQFISQGGALVYFINTVFLHGMKRGFLFVGFLIHFSIQVQKFLNTNYTELRNLSVLDLWFHMRFPDSNPLERFSCSNLKTLV